MSIRKIDGVLVDADTVDGYDSAGLVTKKDVFSGLVANRPDVATMLEGAIFVPLDALYIETVVAGAWVKSFTSDYFIYPEATLIGFQTTPATGTCSNPDRTNDDNTSLGSVFDVIGEYAGPSYQGKRHRHLRAQPE
ncbi:hypothetical protein ES705_40341 [subsurface metagenome]